MAMTRRTDWATGHYLKQISVSHVRDHHIYAIHIFEEFSYMIMALMPLGITYFRSL